MDSYDIAIVGAGIVGLALARALLLRQPGTRVVVLEKEATVAAHQTGHNSGVIHSGVYYRPGSLKARLCVTGSRALAAYCREHGLAMQTPGKVIVAVNDADLPRLREVERRGRENGVEGLRWLSASALAALEPHIRGVAALHVPVTAIVDYAEVARSYQTDIAAQGGEVRLGCAVTGFARDGAAIIVEGDSRAALRARQVINCAGLFADRIAMLAGSEAARHEFRILPFRGEYYSLRPPAAALLRGLVYPVPDPRFPFLGVHFTPRVHGGVEAGPSAVLAWKREGYRRRDVSLTDVAAMAAYRGSWAMAARYWRKGLGEQVRSLNRRAYIRALRGLLPALRDADVAPGGAGVRAQVVLRSGKLLDDFHVLREGRFTHVINVPSPAATASLAIADHLANLCTDGG
ncbi:MAG: L-2-hydroxyglutarate oxidase [Terriglobales bacterium]